MSVYLAVFAHLARSAEKAMTALARWRAVYVDKVQLNKNRPALASNCDNLKDALFFRRQLTNEVSRKVAQIQNPSLGEFKIRDLNDEINKLLRQKGYWEDRIKELGGPDYKKMGPRIVNRDGREVSANRGYRYFGAARDLPGVRELFEAEPQPPAKKSRGELMKNIDVDYYGYRDEDDGVILPVEMQYERELMTENHPSNTQNETPAEEANIYLVDFNPADAITEADNPEQIEDYTGEPTQKRRRTEATSLKTTANADEEDLLQSLAESRRRVAVALTGDRYDSASGTLDPHSSTGVSAPNQGLLAHVPVPSQEQVEAALVRRKKQELLEKYMSDDLLAEMVETRAMMGIEVEGREVEDGTEHVEENDS